MGFILRKICYILKFSVTLLQTCNLNFKWSKHKARRKHRCRWHAAYSGTFITHMHWLIHLDTNRCDSSAFLEQGRCAHQAAIGHIQWVKQRMLGPAAPVWLWLWLMWQGGIKTYNTATVSLPHLTVWRRWGVTSSGRLLPRLISGLVYCCMDSFQSGCIFKGIIT